MKKINGLTSMFIMLLLIMPFAALADNNNVNVVPTQLGPPVKDTASITEVQSNIPISAGDKFQATKGKSYLIDGALLVQLISVEPSVLSDEANYNPLSAASESETKAQLYVSVYNSKENSVNSVSNVVPVLTLELKEGESVNTEFGYTLTFLQRSYDDAILVADKNSVISPSVILAKVGTPFKFSEGSTINIEGLYLIYIKDVFDGKMSLSPIAQPSIVTFEVTSYASTADVAPKTYTLKESESIDIDSTHTMTLNSVDGISASMVLNYKSSANTYYVNVGDSFKAKEKDTTIVDGILQMYVEKITDSPVASVNNKVVTIDLSVAATKVSATEESSYQIEIPAKQESLNIGEYAEYIGYKIYLDSIVSGIAEFHTEKNVAAVCGNGILESDEECEVGYSTGCASVVEYPMGYTDDKMITCNQDCKLDISECVSASQYVTFDSVFKAKKGSSFNIENVLEIKTLSVIYNDGREANALQSGAVIQIIDKADNIGKTINAINTAYITKDKSWKTENYEIRLLDIDDTYASLMAHRIASSDNINAEIDQKIIVPLNGAAVYKKEGVKITYAKYIDCDAINCPKAAFQLAYVPRVHVTDQKIIIPSDGKYSFKVAWYDTAGVSNISVMIKRKTPSPVSVPEIFVGQFKGANNYVDTEVDLGQLQKGDEVIITVQTQWWGKWYEKVYSTDEKYFQISYVAGTGYEIKADDGIRYDRGFNDVLMYVSPSDSADIVGSATAFTVLPMYERTVTLGVDESFRKGRYVLTALEITDKSATIVLHKITAADIDESSEEYVSVKESNTCSQGCLSVQSTQQYCICPKVSLSTSAAGSILESTTTSVGAVDSVKIIPGSNKMLVSSQNKEQEIIANNLDGNNLDKGLDITSENGVVKVTSDTTNQETYISENGYSARTKNTVVSKDNSFYILDAGDIASELEVKLLPSTAAAKALLVLSSYNDATLTQSNGKAVYIFSNNKSYKILGFIPSTGKVYAIVDADSGEVTYKQPWYSGISTK